VKDASLSQVITVFIIVNYNYCWYWRNIK